MEAGPRTIHRSKHIRGPREIVLERRVCVWGMGKRQEVSECLQSRVPGPEDASNKEEGGSGGVR